MPCSQSMTVFFPIVCNSHGGLLCFVQPKEIFLTFFPFPVPINLSLMSVFMINSFWFVMMFGAKKAVFIKTQLKKKVEMKDSQNVMSLSIILLISFHTRQIWCFVYFSLKLIAYLAKAKIQSSVCVLHWSKD